MHDLLNRAGLICTLGLLLGGCGSVVFLDDDGSGSTSGATSTSSSGTSSSSTSSGSGGGAPGCPTSDGVVVVGCGFHSNAVVLDGDDEALYVLDAMEGDAAFFETLWRLDLESYARTALYEGIVYESPLDRTQSFARSGAAFYASSRANGAPLLVRIPVDGGGPKPIVTAGVKDGGHVAADPFSAEGAYFEGAAGVSRVEPEGSVTVVSTLPGTLFGATTSGAAIASGGSTHVVDQGSDIYYGPIDDFGAAHAHLRGGLLLVPIDAGLGGLHEIHGYYPDADFTQAMIPDGEGAGPPRFVRQATIAGEINVVLFVQGTATAGLAFMFVGEETSGLFGDEPPLGGAHVVRGPAIMARNGVYAAAARASDGGDGALEGAILQMP